MEHKGYGRLHNALVELCVVVGMDEDTGLVPEAQASCQVFLNSCDFSPFILAAVSGEFGVFPQTGCPPVETFVTQSDASIPQVQSTTKMCSPKKLGRQPTLSPSVAIAKTAELPLSSEEISGLPPICLPDSTKVFRWKPSAHCHSFVMTDLSGVHRYAMCLTYYRKFVAVLRDKEKPNCYELCSADCKQLDASSEQEECYVPTCICLIANQPYYQVLKRCLSSLLPKLTNSTLELQCTLLEFVPKLALIPVPPAGIISVKFSALGVSHSLHPALPYRPVCGIHLYYPFTLLSVDSILTVVSCILTEKRIVFLSSSISLLTPVIESFFAFILPFTWRHTYIPVLPSKMTDYISAPGTFIMGCHSRVADQIDELCPDGIVTVSLDEGTVVMDREPPAPLPSDAVDLFKSRFGNFPKPFDLQTALPSFLDAEEESRAREKHATQLDAAIRAAFVEMLALIFGNVNTFCGFDSVQSVFQKNKFLASREKQNYEFYKQVCTTDMFDGFINKRMQRRQDYFDQEVEELKAIEKAAAKSKDRVETRDLAPGGTASLRQRQLRKLSERRPFVDLKSVKPLSIDRHETDMADSARNELFLPEVESSLFQNGGHFYNVCLEIVTSALEQADSAFIRASYRFIRGMLHLACGSESKGVQDLQTIEKENRMLYPEKLLNKLTGKDNKVTKLHIIDADQMPWHDLDEREFETLTVRMSIFPDLDSAAKGWACLSKDQHMPNELFRSFVNVWKEVMKTADQFELPDVAQLQPGEDVVLISGRVRHSQGIGRLVLTHHRLFVMRDAVCHKVTELTDISAAEKITTPSWREIGQDGLKITLHGGEQYTVFLKMASALWQLCIEEMIAANKLALGYKNPSIVHSAAANVMVVHALDELMQDFDVISMKGGSERLAEPETLLSCRLKDDIKLPLRTFEALDRIIFPPSYVISKSTIECMLYTEPDDAGKPGQLWCSYGSSLLVCDIVNWNFELPIPISHSNQRISCMATVGETLWVGSLDKYVYVINMATRKVVSSLPDLEDFVVGIIRQETEKSVLVWTIGVDGQFIPWNPDSRTRNKQLEFQIGDINQGVLSPVFTHEHIWFLGERKKTVIVVDTKSPDKIIRRLTTKSEPKNPLSASSLVVTPNQQVWCSWSETKGKTRLVAWSSTTYEQVFSKDFESYPGFSCMVIRDSEVWMGTNDGRIFVLEWNTACRKDAKEMKQAHGDAVRSLCVIHGSRVASGSTSSEGHIAIWK